ncbi:MAG: hypothetical protein AAB250_03835 [Bdellovibrionota bacterium]
MAIQDSTLLRLETSQSETPSFVADFFTYVGRVREFTSQDWKVYIAWIGLMLGLLFAECLFLFTGHFSGVTYPIWVWNVPLGTFVFVTAIAIDTIGHRTIYKEVLKKGEALVHHITIFAGITSVLGLCLGYDNPEIVRAPVIALIALSVIYSLVDEVLHWHRYLTKNSDRVEMWSHFFILLGHTVMMLSWWAWYDSGYPGVKETLAALQ